MIVSNDRTGQNATSDPTGAGASAAAGDEYFRIEQVAARTGLTKRTLRYYEEIGLLAPPTRTEGGYRLYSPSDIQQLQRIKRLKDLLGFSLAEIREIAQMEEQREQLKAAWAHETDPRTRLAWLDRSEALTRRQLTLVEEKLQGLEEMRTNLLSRLETQERHRSELLAQVERE
jgi:DNA-binding transcriptional MerR regulator